MKKVSRTLRGLLVLWTSLLLGCANNNSGPALAQIKAVSIDPAVPKPKDIFYEDPSTLGTGMAFGIFGKVARSSSVRGQIYRRTQDNRIEVERIVSDEFAKALKEKAGIAVAASGPADGRFHLEIAEYGFRMKGMISGSLTPIMTLSAQLRGVDGRVLWEGEEKMNATKCRAIRARNTWAIRNCSKKPSQARRKVLRAICYNRFANSLLSFQSLDAGWSGFEICIREAVRRESALRRENGRGNWSGCPTRPA